MMTIEFGYFPLQFIVIFLEIRMMTVGKKIIKGREPGVDPKSHHNHQLLLFHHHLAMCQVAAHLSLLHPLHHCRWNVEGQQNSKPLLQARCTHLTGEGEDVIQAPFPALVSNISNGYGVWIKHLIVSLFWLCNPYTTVVCSDLTCTKLKTPFWPMVKKPCCSYLLQCVVQVGQKLIIYIITFFLTAAEVHIISLLEYIKHQQEQLVAKVNYLTSRLNPTGQEMEMPIPVQFPLASMEEVESFEDWLKDPVHSQMKQSLVSFFVCFFIAI